MGAVPPIEVSVRMVRPLALAAVRREVAPAGIGSAWKPALDKVWAFVRTQPGLWTTGHNVFLYRRPKDKDGPMLCDFGVEVTRSFDAAGEVYPMRTPEGEAAVAIHRGAYHRLPETHRAIQAWLSANQRVTAEYSWEVYGDPMPDPAATETTVFYLLERLDMREAERGASGRV